MLGRAIGAVLYGVDARLVDVEVDLTSGLPSIAAVGLLDSAVREGIDRVRSALRHAGFTLPPRRIVINLAPAELPKQGGGLDLPIAVALLRAAGSLDPGEGRTTVFLGELALDGSVRPVRGAVSAALAARAAGRVAIVVPAENAAEAVLVDGLDVVAVRSLADLAILRDGARHAVDRHSAATLLAREERRGGAPDLADVRGQFSARRAIEIAAAGGHHVLLCGPPGSGKTLLAQRLPGVLPPLEPSEALEVTRIHSAAGIARALVCRRPFRAPHHGISAAGLTGGGRALRPGEVSLASHGVLYLDELTEFRRDALEALRQPLEDGAIRVSRVHGTVELPAEFTLVASMNPCPCGFHGGPHGRCSCSPSTIARYRTRISGPLLDRFDLVIPVPPVEPAALGSRERGEPSAAVRTRVVRARERQRARVGGAGPSCNARMDREALDRYAALEPQALGLLVSAADRLGLTGRGFDRVRRTARTIADLDGAGEIGPVHVAEALQYRPSDALGPR
jgi:magnesium chelatase family protein